MFIIKFIETYPLFQAQGQKDFVRSRANPQERLQHFAAETKGTADMQGAGYGQIKKPHGDNILLPWSAGYLAYLERWDVGCRLKGLLILFALYEWVIYSFLINPSFS